MIIKKLRLLLIYSKDFLFYSILITILSYFIYYNTGNSGLTIIIWFKIITSIIGIFVHQDRKSNELFFYMNNGLGKKELMTTTVGLDLGIWTVGMIALVRSML